MNPDLSAWLEAQHSPHTRRAYRRAVLDLITHANQPAGQITAAHVAAWQADLRKAGLKPATINLKLAAVSSYFAHVDPTSNPAANLDRPHVQPYRKATALAQEQAKDLLQAVDRSTIQGIRDYAILVSFLLTGARNTELRTIRWIDLTREGNRIIWYWTGKGDKSQPVQFPWSAYHCIVDYLVASGRLPAGYQPGQSIPENFIHNHDYIFIAHSDAAERLPTVDENAPNQPLSGTMINRLVKKYARHAGIKSRVTTHSLRHTAAMLRKEHTDDILDIQRFLHHTHLNTTQIYLDHLVAKPDAIAPRIATLLGVQ
jgi:site-specific recombinase XerD